MQHEKTVRIFSLLRCPLCKTGLNRNDDRLVCSVCEENFEVVNGVPVMLLPDVRKQVSDLLNRDTGAEMVDEYSSGSSMLYNLLRPPEVHFNAGIDLSGSGGDRFYGPGALVLNLGGGPTRFRDQEITLNIGLFPNVDIVADAHDVPLPDASFDTVICNAVLEHVADPHRVVSEIYRLLKPGGQVYAEVPFLWFYHGYPSDFWRFTRDGFKRLMVEFNEVEIGVTQGPTGALLQQFVMYIIFFLGLNKYGTVRKITSFVLRWLIFPFKYLDLWLNSRSDAHTLAGGFYIVGCKGD